MTLDAREHIFHAVDEIVRGIRDQRGYQDSLLVEYTCTKTSISRTLGKGDEVKEETIVITQEYDAKDSTSSTIIREERFVKGEKVSADVPERKEKDEPDKGKRTFTFDDPFSEGAEGRYDYRLMEDEVVGGRPCFVVRIVPRRKDEQSIDGTYWVDKAEYGIVRYAFEPVKDQGGIKDGRWEAEHVRVAEKIWLPGSLSISGRFRFLFWGGKMEHVETMENCDIKLIED